MQRIQKYIRLTGLILLGVIILICLSAAVILFPYYWRNISTYPVLEDARKDLAEKYKSPEILIDKHDYKGVVHAHHYWSHDSRGNLTEILPAAKQAGLDYIFFSDHIRDQLDTFPRGISGIIDGILFESGTESKGLMVSPLRNVVIDWGKEKNKIVQGVTEAGGLVVYVHTEESHDWEDPHYQAMEIYNIHTDFIDEGGGLVDVLLNSLVNGKSYRHWVYRELYNDQTKILSLWDSLNTNRKIVGVGSVDAHNNQSIRARYTNSDKVEWVGPDAKTITITEPGFVEWLLLSKPDIAGWAFKFEIDTYFASFNYVNNHVFTDSLTSRSIKNSLVAGNTFLSFENLAEAKGFQFVALDNTDTVKAIMGDSVAIQNVAKLKAVSPYPVQFRLMRNGEKIISIDNVYTFEYEVKSSPGNYRLEASLQLNDTWYTWIYTNPIYLYELELD